MCFYLGLEIYDNVVYNLRFLVFFKASTTVDMFRVTFVKKCVVNKVVAFLDILQRSF